MTSKRSKFENAFSILLVLIAAAAYPLSFGPACWLADHGFISMRATATVYKPLVLLALTGPRRIRCLLRGYAEWQAEPAIPTWVGPREDPKLFGVLERLAAAE
jgi:hypothetical protein